MAELLFAAATLAGTTAAGSTLAAGTALALPGAVAATTAGTAVAGLGASAAVPAGVAALIGGGGGAATAAGAAGSLGSTLMLGSSLTTAAGSIMQGFAQSQAASYNAAVQRQQANIELQQSAAKATDAAVRTRQRVAAMRAANAQNGFENTGSALDVLRVADEQGALEGLTAIYDGTMRARGLRASAALNDAQGRNALFGSGINATSGLLGGVARAYFV